MREGHAIGIHGYHHQGKMLVSGQMLRAELERAAASIAAALGRAGVAAPPRPRLFRPPFGFLTEATAAAAAGDGFAIVLWTVSVRDWEPGITADTIVERVLARVGPGDVIVLHDGERTHHRRTKPFYNIANRPAKYKGEGMDEDMHRHFCDLP